MKSWALVFAASLITVAIAAADEPRAVPDFPVEFTRHRVGAAHTSFNLCVPPPPENGSVTATLVMLRDRQIMARIPLRQWERKHVETPLVFGVLCVANDSLEATFAESHILLVWNDGDDANTRTYSFPLTEAVDQNRKK